MAANSATAFPVRGQIFRFGLSFVNSSTGATITTWTGNSLSVYCDGVLTAGGTFVENPVASGAGYIELTAAQMTADMVQVIASISNSGAVVFTRSFSPLQLQQFTGRWDETQNQPLLVERLWKDIAYFIAEYGAMLEGASLQFMNEDGSVHATAGVTQAQLSGTRSIAI